MGHLHRRNNLYDRFPIFFEISGCRAEVFIPGRKTIWKTEPTKPSPSTSWSFSRTSEKPFSVTAASCLERYTSHTAVAGALTSSSPLSVPYNFAPNILASWYMFTILQMQGVWVCVYVHTHLIFIYIGGEAWDWF